MGVMLKLQKKALWRFCTVLAGFLSEVFLRLLKLFYYYKPLIREFLGNMSFCLWAIVDQGIKRPSGLIKVSKRPNSNSFCIGNGRIQYKQIHARLVSNPTPLLRFFRMDDEIKNA